MKYAVLTVDSNNSTDKIQKAKQLAEKLHLPLISHPNQQTEAYLILEDAGLAIWIPHLSKKSYCVNFESETLLKRGQYWFKELIARACGLNKNSNVTIVDATAGFGRDAFILAQACQKIYLLEQHPIVWELLASGRERISNKLLQNRLMPIKKNSIDFLKDFDATPDIIYLDPMFEKDSKRAKVKKDLQILQYLCQNIEQNTQELFCVALQKAHQRVVVKRPLHGLYLENKKPSFSLKGKDSRFDVYLI